MVVIVFYPGDNSITTNEASCIGHLAFSSASLCSSHVHQFTYLTTGCALNVSHFLFYLLLSCLSKLEEMAWQLPAAPTTGPPSLICGVGTPTTVESSSPPTTPAHSTLASLHPPVHKRCVVEQFQLRGNMFCISAGRDNPQQNQSNGHLLIKTSG
jgi:hypothetical protein